MNNPIRIILLVAISIVVSSGITKYFFPKVEYKNVEVIKEVVRNDIKTIVKTIERPDGTKETISETTDKSTKKETSKSETIKLQKSEWMFGGGTRFNLRDHQTYGEIQIIKRISGPILVSTQLSSDRSVSVNLLIEF